MPRIPDSVKKPVNQAGAKLRDRTGGLSQTLRRVDAKRAKSSAANGVGGAKDAVRLAIAYAKQETIEPMRGLGRFLAFGIAGGVLLGFGLVLSVLALLRGVQTETGSHLVGNLSWIPYLIAAFGCLVVLGLIGMAFVRTSRSSKRGL